MKKRWITFLLMIVLAFHTIVNIAWQAKNEVPSGKDWSLHLNYTANLMQILQNEYMPHFYKFDKGKLFNLFFISYDYPPLYYYVAISLYQVFFLVFGYKAIFFASHFFLLLLILFVYKIGSKLYDKKVGLLAAVMCSLYPLNYTSSRYYDLEIATSAMVAVTWYAFFKAKDKFDIRHVVVFGILFAGSLLVKYTAGFFFFGVFLWYIAELFNRPKYLAPFSKRIVSLIVLIFIIISISSIYYANGTVIERLLARGTNSNPYNSLSYRLLFYIREMFMQGTGMLLGTVFLLSLLKMRNNKISQKLFFFTAAPAFFIIAGMPKNFVEQMEYVHYLMPLLFVIAILSASAVLSIRWSLMRRVVAASIIIISIFQFFTNSFFSQNYSPQKCATYETLIDDIGKDVKNSSPTIGILAESTYASFEPIFYTAIFLRRKPWKVVSLLLHREGFFEQMPHFDYVIYAAQEVGDSLKKDEKFTLIRDGFRMKKIYTSHFEHKYTYIQFHGKYKK